MIRRVFGLMVIKNEAHRYLEHCLRHNMQYLDRIFVYDDLSIDNSAEIANDLGCLVSKRSEMQPSFLENEAKFREQAWHRLYSLVSPRDNDWIVSIDADEFLCAAPDALGAAISRATRNHHDAVTFKIPEVFGYADSGAPLIRTDGYWGSITGVRAVRANGIVTFANRAMGGGSVPERVRKPLPPPDDVHLLHYGYANYEDRCDKYDRYSSHKNNGHNNRHIESIMKQPSLIEWTGPYPSFVHV